MVVNSKQYKRLTIALAIGWIVIVLAGASWNVWIEYQHLILKEPRDAIHRSLVRNTALRQWLISHGGVYVPISDVTHPNPYLARVPDRDIETPSGRKLTLLNPAYAIRNFAEYAKNMKMSWHLTSLNLLNPDNAPDEWERAALQTFEQGAEEIIEYGDFEGKPYLRLMKPLKYSERCQKCHGQMGYELGDIRGGVGANFPMEKSWQDFYAISLKLVLIYLGLLFLSLIMIGFVYARRRKSHAETEKLELKQRLANEALRKREAQLAESQEVAKLGSWDLNLVPQEVYWSAETYRLFDKDPEKLPLSFDEFARLVHPDDRVAMKACFNRAMGGDNNSCHMENRIINDSGREWVMEAHGKVRRNECGKAISMFGTAQDVTEQRRRQNEIKELQQQIEFVLGATSTRLDIIDSDFNIRYIDPEWERSYGPVNGKKCFQYVAELPGPCPDCGVVEAMKTKKIAVTEGILPRENNRPIQVTTIPFQGAGGECLFAEVKVDISERKKAEGSMQKAHDELEQRVEERTLEWHEAYQQLLHAEKLSAIGQLSASIAHEFNNPLQGVMTVIKGIRRRASLEGEDDKLVDMAVKECERMRDLIKSLQDFNRPTSDRVGLIDLHVIIDSILLLSRNDFKARGVTVETNYTRGLPQIKVVADQIKQVFLNLLSNAAYACEGGGKITINTEVIRNEISIQVQDTGKGIRPEDVGHIFEPFFTTKPEIKGSGLGLSVSYGIVKKHGGRIEVESEVDRGTKFTVTLPRESE